MNTHITRVLSALATVAAVGAMLLVGPGALAAPAPATASHVSPAQAGFQPVAASFLSAAQGFALGGAGCAAHNCQAQLAATTDGGRHWRHVHAPDADLSAFGRSGSIGHVLFASARDGWLYGPGLYATHDRGAHWRRIALPGIVAAHGGGVTAMVVSAAIVYAIVSPDPLKGRPTELFRSQAGGGAWTRVSTVTPGWDTFAASGRSAWFAGTTHLWSTADGVHWKRYRLQCPADYRLTSMTAASASRLRFLCSGEGGMGRQHKVILWSADGGKTEHAVGPGPLGGVGGVIAVPPGWPMRITLAAEYYVYRSGNGGRTWKQIMFYGGGAQFTSLHYVSKDTGWMVVQSGRTALLRTRDAGRTWHPVTFAGLGAQPIQ